MNMLTLDTTRLASGFSGDLLHAGDATYDQHRHVWNGMIDKHPAVIARCRTNSDVIAALEFARDRDLPLAVRGGGHSFAGFSTCDDGLVIDLGPMQSVSVDTVRRRARAGAGVTWAGFDAATHEYGLATTGGLISTTGIAGLTLGGGIGWLQRKYGLACDNLLAVEMVTPAGEVVRASEAENAELFWGIRGGGGNFGVVTSFEFRLHPVSEVTGGLLLFAHERAAEVMGFYRDYVNDLPDELTTWLSMITAPTAEFIPKRLQGKPALAFLACHCGHAADAVGILRPVRDLHPDADLIEPLPYPVLQSFFDEDLPPGTRCYLKAGFATGLSDSMVATIVEHTRVIPSAASTFDFHHMGGAVAAVEDDATAFGDRRSPFCFNIVGAWHEAEDDDVNRDWVRTFASALEPFGTGGFYVNFAAEARTIEAAFGAAKLARLRDLKRRYDPDNLLRLNQNVSPSTRSVESGDPALEPLREPRS